MVFHLVFPLAIIIGPSLPTTTIHNVPAPRQFAHCNTYTSPITQFLLYIICLPPPPPPPPPATMLSLSYCRTDHLRSWRLHSINLLPMKPYLLISQSQNLACISGIRIELLCIAEVRSPRRHFNGVLPFGGVASVVTTLGAAYWAWMSGGEQEKAVRYEACSRK